MPTEALPHDDDGIDLIAALRGQALELRDAHVSGLIGHAAIGAIAGLAGFAARSWPVALSMFAVMVYAGMTALFSRAKGLGAAPHHQGDGLMASCCPTCGRPLCYDESKLGGYLRTRREERGWSLRDVEAATHGLVTSATLSRLETGATREAMPSTLLAIASAYHVGALGLVRLAAGLPFDEPCGGRSAARDPTTNGLIGMQAPDPAPVEGPI